MTGTFKMTVQEVTNTISNVLKNNNDAKVIEVRLPQNGDSTLSVDLSVGIFGDELLEIGEFFGDNFILISSFEDFDGISLFIHPEDSFWQKEGGAK